MACSPFLLRNTSSQSVLSSPHVRVQGKSAGHCEDPRQQVAGALPFGLPPGHSKSLATLYATVSRPSWLRPAARLVWPSTVSAISAMFFLTSSASILANSVHACRLSRPTRESSDKTTYARRPADPTERPTHLARRTTARRPSRGARAAASTREPCERCGAPKQCRRPPDAGKEGQVVGKALSPGSSATQCVEHGSRVRMFAPVTRPCAGPVHNMRVHQFRPKWRVVGLFPFPHGLRAIFAGRNRVWAGDANVERSALIHRKCRCMGISRWSPGY